MNEFRDMLSSVVRSNGIWTELLMRNEIELLKASYHTAQVDAFIEKHGKEYESVKLIRDSDNIKEWHARNLGM